MMNARKPLPLPVLLLALACVAFCGLAAWAVSQDRPLEQAGQSLAKAHALAEGLRVERAKRLLAGAELAGLDPSMGEALEGKRADPGAAAEVLIRLKPVLRADLMQLAGPDGRLLAQVDAAGPQALTLAAQADTELAKAGRPMAPVVGEGWLLKGQLYETVTGPVLSQQRVLGSLRLGLAWGMPQAWALRQATGCDAALLAPGRVLASSLSPSAEAALASLLAHQAADRAPLEADLGQGAMALRAWPLLGPDGRTVASLVLLQPCQPMGGARLRACLLAAGVCALLAALVLLFCFRAPEAFFKAKPVTADFEEARRCQVLLLAVKPDGMPALTEEPLPEGWARQMAELADWVSEVMRDHGGLLATAPEGCLLALWQLENGADGQAALEAALEILDRAARMDKVLRLGLHQGEAWLAQLGPRGQRNLAVLGPEPGLAWQVAGKAAPNQVLASEPVYRHMRSAYEFNRVEAVGRGNSAPLQIFEVLGKREMGGQDA